jgi:hypothetical protein
VKWRDASPRADLLAQMLGMKAAEAVQEQTFSADDPVFDRVALAPPGDRRVGVGWEVHTIRACQNRVRGWLGSWSSITAGAPGIHGSVAVCGPHSNAHCLKSQKQPQDSSTMRSVRRSSHTRETTASAHGAKKAETSRSIWVSPAGTTDDFRPLDHFTFGTRRFLCRVRTVCPLPPTPRAIRRWPPGRGRMRLSAAEGRVTETY